MGHHFPLNSVSRALTIAKDVDRQVSEDILAGKQHALAFSERAAKALPGESRADRKHRVAAVRQQSLEMFQKERLGPNAIPKNRRESIRVAIIEGFKAESNALDDPRHPLWYLAQRIAPDLSAAMIRDKVTQALGDAASRGSSPSDSQPPPPIGNVRP